MVALKRAVCLCVLRLALLGGGVLGDSLGTFADGVLGKLTRQKEADSSLDFTASDGGLLVVMGQTGCLASNTLEDVVDKAVHDAHGTA